MRQQPARQEPAGPAAPPAADEADRRAVHLPPLGALLRHGGLHLAEATLVPLGLFYLLLQVAGLRSALLAALSWSYFIVLVRLLRGRRLPAVLVLATGMLTVRTVVSFITGNAFLYFLQPTLGNFTVGGLFLLSAVLRRPLARRLAGDFCPLPAYVLERQGVRRFFARITVLWAVVNIANGGATLWALLASSLDVVLLARTVGSLAVVAGAIVVSYLLFRRSLRGEGITLHWGAPA